MRPAINEWRPKKEPNRGIPNDNFKSLTSYTLFFRMMFCQKLCINSCICHVFDKLLECHDQASYQRFGYAKYVLKNVKTPSKTVKIWLFL